MCIYIYISLYYTHILTNERRTSGDEVSGAIPKGTKTEARQTHGQAYISSRSRSERAQG